MCNKAFLWLRFNFHKLLVRTYLLPPIIITRVCLWGTKELDQCLLLFPQEPGWHLAWAGSVLGIGMYCPSISNKTIYRPSINRTPVLTTYIQNKTIIFIVIIPSAIISATNNWEESAERGRHTCSLSVYLFFASDRSAV